MLILARSSQPPLRSQRGRSIKHALVELFESARQDAKVEPLEHHLLTCLAQALAHRRVAQQVEDALSQSANVAVWHDHPGLSIPQRELHVFGVESHDRLAQ